MPHYLKTHEHNYSFTIKTQHATLPENMNAIHSFTIEIQHATLPENMNAIYSFTIETQYAIQI